MTSQNNINAFSSDKFTVLFSNIPTVNQSGDLRFLYQNYIKSLTIPDMNIEMIQSHFQGSVINHPVTPDNKDYSDLLIEFRLDENFLNYYNLFEVVQEIRYGKIRKTIPSLVRDTAHKKDSLLRLYTIKSIHLLLLDNERQTQKILEFTECFVHSISTISLEYGKSEEVNFTVNFKYQEMFLKSP